jgi:hypothetical protein
VGRYQRRGQFKVQPSGFCQPPLRPDAQAAAQAKGQQRYEGFVETLGQLQMGEVF